MKRILFLIATVLIGMAAMGQVTTINQNVYGSTVKSVMNTNFSNVQDSIDGVATREAAATVLAAANAARLDTDSARTDDALTQLQDSLGWFNVVSYGAVSGGASDVAAFNTAITAANAQTYGGVVYVPDGVWNIDDTIFLKDNVFIYIPGTATRFDVTYAGPVYYNSEGLDDFMIWGGDYRGSGDGLFTYTLLEFYLESGAWVARNEFMNMIAYNADAMVDIYTASSGWFNDNVFLNIESWDNKRFLRTREGAGSIGIDGNDFSNIAVQSGDSAYFAIDTLSGSWNNFKQMFLWDFDLAGAPATQQSIVLGSTSSFNVIEGGDLGDDDDFTDLGLENEVKEAGHYFTAISDSLTIWSSVSAKASVVNKLNVAHRGSSGTSATPAGDIAIKLKSFTGLSRSDIYGSNSAARVLSQNSAATNNASVLKLQVHGTASDDSEAGYIDGLEIDGNTGGDIKAADNIMGNGEWETPVYFAGKVTISYTDENVNIDMFDLPSGNIAWDVQIEVRTAFDDSGTDVINVGHNVTSSTLVNGADVSGTGWLTLAPSVPHRTATNRTIVAKYLGQNNDASQGSADVYVYYSIHN